MTMRILIISTILLLALTAGETHAQGRNLKKANRNYAKFNFFRAIEQYKKVLDKHPENEEAIRKIASAYRRVNNTNAALEWYGEVVKLESASPQDVLYYANMLRSNCQYQEAKKQYLRYAEMAPQDERGMRLAEGIDKVDAMKADSGKYAIFNLNINSEYADFSPVYYKDDLAFISARDKRTVKTDVWSDNPFLDIYQAAKSGETEFDEPKLMKGNLNDRLHEGPLTFNQTTWEEMYFTRNNYIGRKKDASEEDIIKLAIYRAVREDDKWTDLDELPFCSDAYSVAHPTLTKDGMTMYFASDMPSEDAVGGTDLYMTKWDGSAWTDPVNLGRPINTEGDEGFPFIHPSGTLYFASDGHPGLGSLDIYAADKMGEGWATPENMGAPINSCSDDFGIVVHQDKTKGFFSSNRNGGKGDDDIYGFQEQGLRLKLLVYDEVSGDSLPNAKVMVTGPENNERTFMTGNDGRTIVPVQENALYKLMASKEGYLPNNMNADTKGLSPESPELKIPLTPLDGGLVLSVRVIDKGTRQPIPDAEVSIKDKNGPMDTLVNAGPDGTFQMPVDPGMLLSLNADKYGYFQQNPVEVNTTGAEAPQLFEAVIELDQLGAQNVIRLENIYYDLDKWNIRPDAAKELDKIVALLKQYPEMTIEMRSHCDSRASDTYNIWLSAKRAESSANYILSRGVMPWRLSTTGFGEFLLVNDCTNDVPCTEEQHQMNRRTEFKVITPPKGVKVIDSFSGQYN